MLNNIAVYIAERDVFYREDDDGVYSIESFLAVYTILEVPFEIISALIFAVLATFAVNLPRTIESHFAAALASFAIVSCGESLGIIFNTLSGHAGFAVNIVSTLLSVAQTMRYVSSQFSHSHTLLQRAQSLLSEDTHTHTQKPCTDSRTPSSQPTAAS